MLKVKRSQLRDEKAKAKRREAERALARNGLSALSGRKSSYVLPQSEGDAMKKFWSELWGVEGTYEPDHSAIVGWKAEVRQKVRENRGRGNLPERDEVWLKAVRKQPNWKASGPDMIHANWYKVFPEITSLIRDEIWRVLDEGEVPDWVVEGRTIMMVVKGGLTSSGP